MKTSQLRQIVLDAIYDYNNYHYSLSFEDRGLPEISRTDLFNYAEYRGYTGPIADLFNMADAIKVSVSGEHFIENVLIPLERAQGIYF